MVRANKKSEPEPEQEGGDLPAIAILSEDRQDPRSYVRAGNELLNRLLSGLIKSTDHKRIMEGLKDACLSNTGIPYDDATRAGKDAIASFIGLMESGEGELLNLEEQFGRLDDLRITPDLKKKWTGLIHRTLALQQRARNHPAYMWTYVARNDEPGHIGEVIHMQPLHMSFYAVWVDDPTPNSLIEAPPGHGKTTCYKSLIVWELGCQPELRALYVTDQKDKARKTILNVRGIMTSARYRALFPGVRILGRPEKSEDSGCRFTICRENVTSREPTFEGAAITGLIQGNRYDRIYGDDVCDQKVRFERATREVINERWTNTVESRISNPRHARIRMVCTPWHVDDIAGVIERGVRGGNITNWRVAMFPIDDDARGRAIPLWDKWPTEYLEDQKRRDPTGYNFRFRLNPTTKQKTLVPSVHYYNSVEKHPFTTAYDRNLLACLRDSERWLSIDPAGTSGSASSDTGAVELVLTARGYGFVTNAWSWHVGIVGVMENIAKLIAETPPPGYRGVMFEAQGGVKVGMPAIILQIQQMLTMRGAKAPEFISVDTILGSKGHNSLSKFARLESVAGLIVNKFVRFAGQPIRHPTGHIYYSPIPDNGVALLCNRLKNHDGTKAWDMIDALTQVLIFHRGRIRSPDMDAAAPAQQAASPVVRNQLSEMFHRRMAEMEQATAQGDDFNGIEEEQAFLQSHFTGRAVA